MPGKKLYLKSGSGGDVLAEVAEAVGRLDSVRCEVKTVSCDMVLKLSLVGGIPSHAAAFALEEVFVPWWEALVAFVEEAAVVAECLARVSVWTTC